MISRDQPYFWKSSQARANCDTQAKENYLDRQVCEYRKINGRSIKVSLAKLKALKSNARENHSELIAQEKHTCSSRLQ